MPLPVLLPLVPAAGGAAAAIRAALMVGGTALLARDVAQFRRGPLPVPLPQGLAGNGTLQELVADAVAGALVPVGSQAPPPWGTPDKLAGWLASGVLAYRAVPDLLAKGAEFLWGLLNPPGGTGDPTETGSYSLMLGAGAQRTVSFTIQPWFQDSVPTGGGQYNIPGGASQDVPIEWSLSAICDELSVKMPAAVVNSPYSTEEANAWVRLKRAGLIVAEKRVGGFVGWGTIGRRLTWTTPVKFTDWGEGAGGSVPIIWPAGDPLPRHVEPEPLAAAAAALPVAEPLPATAPRPEPLPVESAQVGLPTGPTTGTATNTATAPATVPTIAPTVKPIQWPGTAPVLPATGEPLPQVLPLPAVPTMPGAVTVGTAAKPITVVPKAVPATLEGIAQETGRIERKLEVLLGDPTSGQPDWLEKAQAGGTAAARILEVLFSLTGGTVYTLDSPCEKDAQGNLLPPVEVEAPGALNAIALLMNRVDALAELLQVHKNLKQPSCKNPRPQGDPVTVNFEEI